jgi:hypothetical protein
LNPGHFVCFTFIFISFGESRLLVSWCVADRCGMAGSDKDHGRSRRHGAEDRGWSGRGRVLSGRTIGRSDDAVCGLHCDVPPLSKMVNPNQNHYRLPLLK